MTQTLSQQTSTNQYAKTAPGKLIKTRLDAILSDLQDLNDRAANLCAKKSEHNERILGACPALNGQAGVEPASPPSGALGQIENLIRFIREHLVTLREYQEFTESGL